MQCDSKELSNLTSSALPFSAERTTIDVLKCFKLHGNKLYATNLNVYGEFDLPDGIEFKNHVNVNAKSFTSIISQLKDEIEIEVLNTRIIIKDRWSSFSINIRQDDAMPTIPYTDLNFENSDSLLLSLKSVEPFTAKFGNIKAYEGVWINNGDIVAMDGKHMAITKVKENIGKATIINSEVIRKLNGVGPIMFAIDEKRAYFKYPKCVISGPLVLGQIVDYSKLERIKYREEAVMNKIALKEAIDKINIIAREDKITKTRMRFENGRIVLSGSSELGDVEASVISYVKQGADFNINIQSVKKWIDKVDSKDISIDVYGSDKISPIKFTGEISLKSDNKQTLIAFIACME